MQSGSSEIKHTNPSGLVDVPRLDTNLASFGVNDTWTVGTNKTRLRLVLECVGNLTHARQSTTKPTTDRTSYPDLVGLGDTLRNANDQRNFVVYGFNNCISSEWRWNIDHSRVGLSLLNGLHKRTRHADGLVNSVKPEESLSSHTSFTDPNTGKPRWVVPAFLGETPPTIFVPYANASLM